MDREEYFFYTLRTPDEYWTEYGRSIESVSTKEYGEAALKYEDDLENYITQTNGDTLVSSDEAYYQHTQNVIDKLDLPAHQVGLLVGAHHEHEYIRLVSDGEQWHILEDNGRVAQSDVQRSSKPKVEGSNPSTPTNDLKNRFDDLLYGRDDE